MLNNKSLRVVIFAAMAVPTVLILGADQVRAQTVDYIAAADYSSTSNPNGVWSYGEEATLGGSFSLYTLNTAINGMDFWSAGPNPAYRDPPWVGHNGLGQPASYPTFTMQAEQLAFHPAPDGEYSVVRFTSPVAGTYALTSSFSGIDWAGPTSTDVHVLLNGVSLFSDFVNEYGVDHDFSTSVTMNAGDTLDFEVGYGSNGNYYYDSTGIAVQIAGSNAVPEPGSVALLLAGGSFLLVCACRPRNAARPSALNWIRYTLLLGGWS